MTSATPPIVTIAIAAYNSAHTIAATVDSCLDQSCPAVEVLVVDDGSTDATPDVLARYGSRIRVVRKPNGGVASGRNAAMQVAQGRYIAWMDGDDLCHPDRLLAQASVLDAFPEAVLVSSNFSAFRDDEEVGDPLYLCTYYSAPARLGGLTRIYPQCDELDVVGVGTSARFTVRRGRVRAHLLEGNFVHPPTVMFRRSALASAGECDTTLRYSSDYEFLLRLSRLGSFALLEAPLLRYRLSGSQLSKASTTGAMQLETIAILDGLRRDDPALHERYREVFSRRCAELYLSAAEAVAATDRRTALSLLGRGLRQQPAVLRALPVCAKIMLPQAVWPALRRMRRLLAAS
jgi:glycosyltransferase involved in cell wall biosynthesis